MTTFAGKADEVRAAATGSFDPDPDACKCGNSGAEIGDSDDANEG